VAFALETTPIEERRRWPRLRVYSPVKYRFLKEDRFQCCITCDLSEGGAGLLLESPLPRGTCLYFQIRLHDLPNPASGIARVTWTSKDVYSQRYRAGVEFLEVSNGSRSDIADFVQKNIPPVMNN